MSQSPLKIAKNKLDEKRNLLRNAKNKLGEKQNLLRNAIEEFKRVEAVVARAEKDVKSAEEDYELQVKIKKTPKNDGTPGTRCTKKISKYLKRDINDKEIENLGENMKKTPAQKRRSLKNSSKARKKAKLTP